MRIAMRALVVLAFPGLMFSWMLAREPGGTGASFGAFAPHYEFSVVPWLLAGGVYFAGALTVVVLARTLVGLWSRPDVSMLPGRTTIAGLALLALLAALPQGVQAGVHFLTMI